MKIRNIGPSQPPTVQKTQKTEKPGKDFAEVLGSEGAQSPSKTTGTAGVGKTQAAQSVLRPEEVRELAQAYRSGQISKKDLMNKIVETVAARVPGLSPSARSRLADRLSSLLEEDPSLVARMDHIDRLADKG